MKNTIFFWLVKGVSVLFAVAVLVIGISAWITTIVRGRFVDFFVAGVTADLLVLWIRLIIWLLRSTISEQEDGE